MSAVCNVSRLAYLQISLVLVGTLCASLSFAQGVAVPAPSSHSATAATTTAASGSGAAADLGVVLATAATGERVVFADLVAELQRAPADTRKSILSRKEMIEQLATNLLQRRILANRAQKGPFANDPVLIAVVQLARERALSDAELAAFDMRNLPSDSALEAQARAAYKANPARFEHPAETRARHILFGGKTHEARVKAQNILKRLHDGASFEELAKAESQDPGSAAKGGDLGFFGAGAMVKPFEDAVNKLQKPGDLSDVVETEFGYHIIRLEERREKGMRPFEEVAESLRNETRAGILREARTRLSQELTKSITVDSAVVEQVSKSGASY